MTPLYNFKVIFDTNFALIDRADLTNDGVWFQSVNFQDFNKNFCLF